ncbi:MAG: hypothetical protein LUD47_07705 [Clostridia bacterium]|nr:hypothetical protein [Clostridia bacterium]
MRFSKAYEALGEDGTIDDYVAMIKGEDWNEENAADAKYGRKYFADDINDNIDYIGKVFNRILERDIDNLGVDKEFVPSFYRTENSLDNIRKRLSEDTRSADEKKWLKEKENKVLSACKFEGMSDFCNKYADIGRKYASFLEMESGLELEGRAHMIRHLLSDDVNDKQFKGYLKQIDEKYPELGKKVRGELKKIRDKAEYYDFMETDAKKVFGAYDVNGLKCDRKKLVAAEEKLRNSRYGKKHPKLMENIIKSAERYVSSMDKIAAQIKAIPQKGDKEAQRQAYLELHETLCRRLLKGEGPSVYKDAMRCGINEMAERCRPDWELCQKMEDASYSEIASGKFNNPNATKKNCIEGMYKEFNAKSFTEDRLDRATVCYDPYMSRGVFEKATKKALANATTEQIESAIDYTGGSDGFNLPLCGYESFFPNGYCWEKSDFRGVGNVNMDAYGKGKAIDALTEIIGKSELDRDVWVERGVCGSGITALFGVENTSYETLKRAVNSGKTVYQPSFCSCGASEGTAKDSNIKLDIFCPKGMNALYVSGLSAFGVSDEKLEESLRDSNFFSNTTFEDELILQRGTGFKPLKIRRDDYGEIHITLAVVEQAPLDYSKL